ncbi:MAG: hypothetical protein KatS3mg035_0148 [Bacteroidia bacterium]|nr:MAG: hypothetical protein KatS3mg035_0148 [Bacteroidia bacterium]
MKVGVIGNGMTATLVVGLLLKNDFEVFHVVNPLAVPHSWASAGIVHPFNFKTASWKKWGFNSYYELMQFLEDWGLKNYFHPTGLFYACEEKGLWNDWYALSERFPEFIEPKEKGIFFPKSGWLQVKKVWDILNHHFLKSPNYQRFLGAVDTKKTIDFFIHAGGIDALKDQPDLPIYPIESQIFKIKLKNNLVPYIFWKQFFLTPTLHPLEYWVGPNYEALETFEKIFQQEYQIIKTLKGIKPYSLTGRAFCLKQNNYLYLNGVGGRGLLEGIRISHDALRFLKNNRS